MSLSPVVDVAIALVLVYYILGLIVSFICARILESLGTRGQDLEDSLKKLVGDAKLPALKAQPQIKALTPVRFKGWQGFFTGKFKDDILIEQIPVSNLVDAVFDMFLLVDKEKPYKADQLTQLIGDLPECDVKKNLLKLVNEGVTDINQLRNKTSMWFTGVLDQAAAYYKAHARQWVIIISLVVTLLFGVDSIGFSTRLWHSAELRANANAIATIYAKQDSSAAQIGQLATDLNDLSFQIGWWSVPANLPKTSAPLDWIGWVVLKILGLGVTTAAVSQGASFWYDMLRQLKGENAAPAKTSASEGETGLDK